MASAPKGVETIKWDRIIRPRSGWFDIHPGEIWRYRDLIALFVWRDFVAVYKQTVLGPLWFLLQPLMTAAVFSFIFGAVAGIPTDGMPPFLFYLSGSVCWKYFADCLNSTSNTFVNNAHIFGKVYFPRLTVPVSMVISNLIALGIQLLLFLAFLVYYMAQGASVHPNLAALLLPFLVLQMAALGLGCGILVSSLTTRYRDLTHLVSFGVQLWMFVTPVVYPASSLPQRWQWLLAFNPMAPVIETFRYALLGAGSLNAVNWCISLGTTFAMLLLGAILFSRVEKSFMDTI